VRRLNRADAT